MDQRIADLIQLLELEQLEVNLFRGESRDIGGAQVFGGQVLGQALSAASKTVDAARLVHSLHAYFLRRGDFNAPIVYSVDRSRDGHSFSSRRVVAIQHGEQIFKMAASFQVVEDGFDHQIEMPQVPPPEELPDTTQPLRELLERLPERVQRFARQPRPFEFRMVQPVDYLQPRKAAPARQVWFRAVSALPDDETLHRCLLAYVSDFYLLDTSTLPHGTHFLSSKIVMASIDHAMWFHRPLRVDEWLLYVARQPERLGRARVCAGQRVLARWAAGCEHGAGRARARGGYSKARELAQQHRVKPLRRFHHQKVSGIRNRHRPERRQGLTNPCIVCGPPCIGIDGNHRHMNVRHQRRVIHAHHRFNRRNRHLRRRQRHVVGDLANEYRVGILRKERGC